MAKSRIYDDINWRKSLKIGAKVFSTGGKGGDVEKGQRLLGRVGMLMAGWDI